MDQDPLLYLKQLTAGIQTAHLPETTGHTIKMKHVFSLPNEQPQKSSNEQLSSEEQKLLLKLHE